MAEFINDKRSKEYNKWLNQMSTRNDTYIMFKQIEPKLCRLSPKALKLFIHFFFNADPEYGRYHIPNVQDFMHQRGYRSITRLLNEMRHEGLISAIETGHSLTINLTPYVDLGEINKYRSMSYAEYLKTEHWQKVRKDALRRAGYKCQMCNEAKPLHVHHRTYERLGCEEPGDVVAICSDCHAKHHKE